MQQQQSNMIKPQKIGVKQIGGMSGGMDNMVTIRPSQKKSKATPKKPTMSQVQKSIKKTMGYK